MGEQALELPQEIQRLVRTGKVFQTIGHNKTASRCYNMAIDLIKSLEIVNPTHRAHVDSVRDDLELRSKRLLHSDRPLDPLTFKDGGVGGADDAAGKRVSGCDGLSSPPKYGMHRWTSRVDLHNPGSGVDQPEGAQGDNIPSAGVSGNMFLGLGVFTGVGVMNPGSGGVDTQSVASSEGWKDLHMRTYPSIVSLSAASEASAQTQASLSVSLQHGKLAPSIVKRFTPVRWRANRRKLAALKAPPPPKPTQHDAGSGSSRVGAVPVVAPKPPLPPRAIQFEEGAPGVTAQCDALSMADEVATVAKATSSASSATPLKPWSHLEGLLHGFEFSRPHLLSVHAELRQMTRAARHMLPANGDCEAAAFGDHLLDLSQLLMQHLWQGIISYRRLFGHDRLGGQDSRQTLALLLSLVSPGYEAQSLCQQGAMPPAPDCRAHATSWIKSCVEHAASVQYEKALCQANESDGDECVEGMEGWDAVVLPASLGAPPTRPTEAMSAKLLSGAVDLIIEDMEQVSREFKLSFIKYGVDLADVNGSCVWKSLERDGCIALQCFIDSYKGQKSSPELDYPGMFALFDRLLDAHSALSAHCRGKLDCTTMIHFVTEILGQWVNDMSTQLLLWVDQACELDDGRAVSDGLPISSSAVDVFCICAQVPQVLQNAENVLKRGVVASQIKAEYTSLYSRVFARVMNQIVEMYGREISSRIVEEFKLSLSATDVSRFFPPKGGANEAREVATSESDLQDKMLKGFKESVQTFQRALSLARPQPPNVGPGLSTSDSDDEKISLLVNRVVVLLNDLNYAHNQLLEMARSNTAIFSFSDVNESFKAASESLSQSLRYAVRGLALYCVHPSQAAFERLAQMPEKEVRLTLSRVFEHLDSRILMVCHASPLGNVFSGLLEELWKSISNLFRDVLLPPLQTPPPLSSLPEDVQTAMRHVLLTCEEDADSGVQFEWLKGVVDEAVLFFHAQGAGLDMRTLQTRAQFLKTVCEMHAMDATMLCDIFWATREYEGANDYSPEAVADPMYTLGSGHAVHCMIVRGSHEKHFQLLVNALYGKT